jgi:uncharacterized protein YdhG (YjbR/CyaY superfamily)
MGERKRYHTVDEYIEDHAEETKQALYDMKACIVEAAPEALEGFNYGIPAFALIEGGKRDQQIMIAGYKNHVGFYPHPDTIAHFVDELQAYTYGKGSIQFPNTAPIPRALIVKMVRWRKAEIDKRMQEMQKK